MKKTFLRRWPLLNVYRQYNYYNYCQNYLNNASCKESSLNLNRSNSTTTFSLESLVSFHGCFLLALSLDVDENDDKKCLLRSLFHDFFLLGDQCFFFSFLFFSFLFT